MEAPVFGIPNLEISVFAYHRQHVDPAPVVKKLPPETGKQLTEVLPVFAAVFGLEDKLKI
jgi:hypothetical protein